MSTPRKRYQVYSIRRGDAGVVWTRTGFAYLNADGSIAITLDSLPLDGKLHIRAEDEKAALHVETKPEGE